MRKYLIAAVAALTAVAFTAVAIAQTPAASMSVKIAPKKAGTKKKPKNSSIELFIKNNDPKKTLSKLVITSPKTFKLSAKGLTKCSRAVLEDPTKGPSACPKASIVGGGEANALFNVASPSPLPLHFDVTAVVLGPKLIGFQLHAESPAALDIVSPGRINGRKLTIQVPPEAQQPAPNVFAGLKDIHTTLKAKKGKKYLASTTGCKKKKHAFSTVLTFIDNGVSTPGNVTVKGSSKCS